VNIAQLSDDLAPELCALHFPVLESLCIADSNKLTDRGLLSGPSSIVSLKSLRLVNCTRITWKGVLNLPKTSSLTISNSLGIDNCIIESNSLLPPGRQYFEIVGSNSSLDKIVLSLSTSL